MQLQCINMQLACL